MTENLKTRTVSVQPNNGRVDNVILSTENPVKTTDNDGEPIYEILSHDERHIKLDRAQSNTGLPLLEGHHMSLDAMLGRFENARLEDKQLRGDLLIGTSSGRGEAIFRGINDGTIADLSVGYIVENYETVGEREGLPLKKAVNWEPIEASIVVINADHASGTRQMSTRSQPMEHKMPTENEKQPAESSGKVEVTQNAPLSQRELIIQYSGQASHNPLAGPLAQRMIQENKDVTLEQYFAELSEATQKREVEKEGISKSDREEFSFLNLINALGNGDDPDVVRKGARELEITREFNKRSSTGAQQSGGNTIPASLLTNPNQNTSKRVLTTVTGQAGSNLVEQSLGSVIEFLRDSSKVLPLCRSMNFGPGQLNLPRLTGGVTSNWVSNNPSANDAASDPTTDQVEFPLKSLSSHTVYQRALLLQANTDVETLLRSDIAASMGEALDKAILLGGGADAITGLVSDDQPATSTLDFGNAPGPVKREHALGLVKQMAENNALRGNLAFFANPDIIYKMQLREISQSGRFLVDEENTREGPDGQLVSTLVGYPLYSTTLIPNTWGANYHTTTGGTNKSAIMFGNWLDYVFVNYSGGLTVSVNPYLYQAKRQLAIFAHLECGGDFRHRESFSYLWRADTVVA